MQLRLRFVWNKRTHPDPLARMLKGLARVIDDETAAGHCKTLWLDARALLKITVLAGIVGWGLTVGGISLWLDRDPGNRVGFADLACPWRWRRISDLRGQGYLAAGLEALRAQRINQGLFQIRQGLARHPDAPDTRLAVAQLYARAGYYAGVRTIMLPQLEISRPPREFIRFLLEAAGRNGDHATMLAVSERELAAEGAEASERAWLLEQKATALIALRKPADALVVLDSTPPNRSLEWRRLRIMALFETERANEAVTEIRAWPAGSVPVSFRLELLAMACRRAGRLDEMAAALAEFQRVYPTALEPRLAAIRQYALAGSNDAAWREVLESLRRFDAQALAVARIEAVCVEVAAPDLVALCVENARQQGRPLILPLCDLTLTQLHAGDAAAAARTFERLLVEDRKTRDRAPVPEKDVSATASDSPGFHGSLIGTVAAATGARPEMTPVMRDFLRTLLDAVAQPASDRAEAFIITLRAGNLGLDAFVGGAEVLAKFGHWAAVTAVARAGLTRFPGNTQLARRSETAGGRTAALSFSTSSDPAARSKASPAASSGAGPTEMPRVEFFAKLDEAMQLKDWAEASGLLHEIKAAAPTWWRSVEADLAWREVRIAFEQDDRPQLLNLIGQRIRTRKAEVPRALEFARWYNEKGEFDTARSIMDKIPQEASDSFHGQDFMNEFMKPAETKTNPLEDPAKK